MPAGLTILYACDKITRDSTVLDCCRMGGGCCFLRGTWLSLTGLWESYYSRGAT